MRKVSLGSGFKYKGSNFDIPEWSDNRRDNEKKKITEFSDFIGIDKGDYGQQYKRDIRRGLPFDDDSVDLLVADNVLEHIPYGDHFGEDDFVFIMNECLRVLKVDGLFRIVVPHWASEAQAKDPTHCRNFAEKSFAYLEKENAWEYGFNKGWKVDKAQRGERRPHLIYFELRKVKNG